MYEARILLEKYWIDRQIDRELFYKTRRELGLYRKFFTEQLGWRIVQNENIIKLEKTPVIAHSCMGIQEFTDINDYLLLCALLSYLDHKEDEEQFLLSELISLLDEEVKGVMALDWTLFSLRKSLVRVLEFAEKRRLLICYDGKSDNLSRNIATEVLYENTGLSRYFAVHFGYDIDEFISYQDFENVLPADVAGDRGHFRTNRVYRQLVAAPAFYWQEADNQDAIYLKNQRQWVEKNLRDHLGGQLHVQKNGAFFVCDEENTFGEYHPGTAMLPQLVLIFCYMIHNLVNEGKLKRSDNELIHLTTMEFSQLVKQCSEQSRLGWSKQYRDMSMDKLITEILSYMEDWLMAEKTAVGITLYPGVGKLGGIYPADFLVEDGED